MNTNIIVENIYKMFPFTRVDIDDDSGIFGYEDGIRVEVRWFAKGIEYHTKKRILYGWDDAIQILMSTIYEDIARTII